MSEGEAGYTPAKVDRRTALKKIGGVAAASGLAGFVAGGEAQTAQEGVQTAAGTFFPLTEVHTAGIQAKDLPEQLDGFFSELSISGRYLFNSEPSWLLLSKSSLLPIDIPLVEKIKFIKDDVVEQLSHQKTKIIFGDIALPAELIAGSLAGFIIRTHLGSSMMRGSPAQTRPKKEHFVDQSEQQPTSPRRTFLKKVAGAALVVPYLGYLGAVGEQTLGVLGVGQQEAIRRILSRFDALTSHLAPENALVFFRNLMMADKNAYCSGGF